MENNPEKPVDANFDTNVTAVEKVQGLILVVGDMLACFLHRARDAIADSIHRGPSDRL